MHGIPQALEVFVWVIQNWEYIAFGFALPVATAAIILCSSKK